MHALTLGPFRVDPDGILHPRASGLRPAIRFAWRGRTCDAALDGTALRIGSVAARVPSTADPGADRQRAFDALATLPRQLPGNWRLRLTPDHRVRLEMDEELEAPPTATSLITALVHFGLAMDPLLSALEAAGIHRAGLPFSPPAPAA